MSKIAVIQMNSQENIKQNLNVALTLIHKATKENVDLIVLPENFLYIGDDKDICFNINSHELNTIKQTAKEFSTIILAGSFPEDNPSDKPFNTSILIDRQGHTIGTYRKIHLFDVKIGNSKEFKESSHISAGEKIVTAKSDIGKIGLTICYDLRFPELYRNLALSGCEIIIIPSNFASQTGKDHWLTLLRARAIENGTYILAPNQYGKKYDGNISYGHSAIIDPWGTVTAQSSDLEDSVIYADLDMNYVRKVRETIPNLNHIKIHSLQKNKIKYH